ncbi:MAG: ArsR/SmtB family transcription factor, partial [Terriglobales bacterium]
PDVDAALARLGAAVGERARARMLLSLLDGAERSSTDLAQVAEVGAATASVHLSRLRTAGLVAVRREGKHRLYRLFSGDVAALLETMTAGAGARPRPPRVPESLRFARSCYDHLAGKLGVQVHDVMRRRGWLAAHAHGYELRPAGEAALTQLGVDVASVRLRHRKFATACLDWSERRPHLGGALGMALLSVALEKRLVNRELDSRALALTSRGRIWFRERLGIAELTT